jgi:hypothetical protein
MIECGAVSRMRIGVGGDGNCYIIPLLTAQEGCVVSRGTATAVFATTEGGTSRPRRTQILSCSNISLSDRISILRHISPISNVDVDLVLGGT